jgi:hypothetical protein
MDKFKQTFEDLNNAKTELSSLKSTPLRRQLLEACDGLDAVRVEDANGGHFHLRVVKQRKRTTATRVAILSALRRMQKPSVTEFLRELGKVCESEVRSLRVTKGTRSPWSTAEAQTAKLANDLKQMQDRRKEIRGRIKNLRKVYVPQEETLIRALVKDDTREFAGDGFLVRRKTLKIRGRLRWADAESKLAPVFDDPPTDNIDEMASLIFEIMNPARSTEKIKLIF